MKKVLFIIDSLAVGGAEKSLVSLLGLLNSNDYDISLWIRVRGGAFENLIPRGVKILSQPKYAAKEILSFKFANMYYSLKLRVHRLLGIKEHLAETYWKCVGKTIKVPEGRWNTVVAYQQGLPTYMLAEKFHDCRKVAWVNCNLFAAGYNKDYNSKFYRNVDAIAVVSKELQRIFSDEYEKNVEDKTVVIYDIINPDVVKALGLESVVEEELFDCALPVLVTTGRLAPQKNHILAVEAAKIMKDRGMKFRWLFVGEGSERKRIESKIKEYGLKDEVVLLGQRMNPYAYMSKCTVYVQCSSFEGFGMTIAEAKILGKPVISTNFDVVNDQIEDGLNGLIVEMTPKALADGIERMLSDESLRNDIASNVSKEAYTKHLTELRKVKELL